MSDPKTYTEEEFQVLQDKANETKTKLDEFRANNVSLLKKQEELENKFKNVDLDAITICLDNHKPLKIRNLLTKVRLKN